MKYLGVRLIFLCFISHPHYMLRLMKEEVTEDERRDEKGPNTLS